MPKLKTHSASKKRFSFTKSGNIKYFHSGKSHLLTKKSKRRKRHLRQTAYANAANGEAIKVLMPYA